MDHRENQEQNTYQKELEQEKAHHEEYDDKVMIDGHPFRIPYKIIQEVTWSNVKKEEMKSLEYAGRLQYRLMLLEPVIRAKVEFTKQKITIIYNPKTSHNRKEKISLEELMEFLGKEGVHVQSNPKEERDFDYVNEMYKYQFDPPSIRERPPYGYTMEEWKKMKKEYGVKLEEGKQKGREKFAAWQQNYAEKYPNVLADKITAKPNVKPTLMQKIFGKKGKKDNDKGFWFHGV